MPILDKLTKATQDMVRGTKDLTDIARYNSLIAEEQKQIASMYTQIGKMYHETGEADPETPLGKLCLALNAANERIIKYNETIRQIKGTKRCPTCSADLSLSATFCGSCGSMIEAVAEMASKFCGNCGAKIDEGLAFCTSCGHKQE